jgi:hypothetical protein
MVTPREQLTARLKETRLNTGFDSQAKMARALNLSRTSIVKAESSHGPVPSDAILIGYARVTGADLEELREIAERCKSGTPEWFGPYLGAEQSATRLRFWEPTVMTGLCQTKAYTSAHEESSAVVQQRLERQRQVLGRADVTVALDQRVFAHRIGSPMVMAEQCGHVATLAEQRLIKLHVVPEGADAGTGGGFAILWAKSGHATVNLETAVQDITTTETTVVAKVLAEWEKILGAALPVVESVEYARQQEETWKERSS